MRDLHLLREFPVPSLIISATIPPSLQRPLLQQLGLSSGALHQTATNRTNIRYCISTNPISTAMLRPQIQASLDSILPQLSPGGQVLFFCKTKEWAENVSQQLDCRCHHSGMEDRDEVLLKFNQGDGRFLACTPGLGAGFDFNHVEWVVHVGSPASLIDFAQESGRAGRRNQPSGSLVLPSPPKVVPSPDFLGVGQLETWLRQHQECRRVALSAYLDGEVVDCAHLEGARSCDVCCPHELISFSSPESSS